MIIHQQSRNSRRTTRTSTSSIQQRVQAVKASWDEQELAARRAEGERRRNELAELLGLLDETDSQCELVACTAE